MSAPSPPTGWSRRLLAAAADLVWPRICMICDRPVPGDTPPGCVCPDCRTAVLADPHPTCPRCTSSVGPYADTSAGCPRCRGEAFRFAGAVRLGPYDGKLRTAVLRMKDASGEPLADTLGRLWAEARRDQLLTGGPAVVVPVPLHWRKRWARGYNQSAAVGRGLAAGLGLDFRPAAIRRVRHTPPQLNRSGAERRENVRGAFAPSRPGGVGGRVVLLVDDVVTTGATADAAAAAVRAAGAAAVRLAVLAHR